MAGVLGIEPRPCDLESQTLTTTLHPNIKYCLSNRQASFRFVNIKEDFSTHNGNGARERTRTVTELPPLDFKSRVSAIPPLWHVINSMISRSSLLSYVFVYDIVPRVMTPKQPFVASVGITVQLPFGAYFA